MVVEFFLSRFTEKARLIKNKQKLKNGYSFFFNFLVPNKLLQISLSLNAGASYIWGKFYTKCLVDTAKSLVNAYFNEYKTSKN